MAFTPLWNIYYPENMLEPAEVPKNLEQQAETIESALSAMKAELAAVMASLNFSGIMVYWLGSLAPAGWALCDGSPHNSANLLALLGTPYAPDFRDRFVMMHGPNFAYGSSGGAISEVLQESQMPRHNHGGRVSDYSESHNHGGTTSAADRSLLHNHGGVTGVSSINHSHGGVRQGHPSGDAGGAPGTAGLQNASPNYFAGLLRVTNNDYGTAAADVPHNHMIPADGVDHLHPISAHGSTHSHTIPESGGGAPVSKLPPYVVASIIIRK